MRGLNGNVNDDKRRASEEQEPKDNWVDGRDDYDMDVDRMINEGLGGGNVTYHNGLIEETTTHTMGIDEEEIESDPSE